MYLSTPYIKSYAALLNTKQQMHELNLGLSLYVFVTCMLNKVENYYHVIEPRKQSTT